MCQQKDISFPYSSPGCKAAKSDSLIWQTASFTMLMCDLKLLDLKTRPCDLNTSDLLSWLCSYAVLPVYSCKTPCKCLLQSFVNHGTATSVTTSCFHTCYCLFFISSQQKKEEKNRWLNIFTRLGIFAYLRCDVRATCKGPSYFRCPSDLLALELPFKSTYYTVTTARRTNIQCPEKVDQLGRFSQNNATDTHANNTNHNKPPQQCLEWQRWEDNKIKRVIILAYE